MSRHSNEDKVARDYGDTVEGQRPDSADMQIWLSWARRVDRGSSTSPCNHSVYRYTKHDKMKTGTPQEVEVNRPCFRHEDIAQAASGEIMR